MIKNYNSSADVGVLYVVATPIGNMKDITFRAIKILSIVDMIITENIYLTKRLLDFYNINVKICSMNEHNEKNRISDIIKKIKSLLLNVALVSNAGTPLISDPGYRLVQTAINKSIKVIPIPGVSAVITSLSVSGLPTDSFIFLGFPARKRGSRLRQLKKLFFEKKTIIFYESSKRIFNFLIEVYQILGNRVVVISREATKVYEEFIRGNILFVLNDLLCRDSIKGEFTLLISGNKKSTDVHFKSRVENDIKKEIEKLYLRVYDISRYISKKYSISKKKAYKNVLKEKCKRKN